MKSQSIFRVSGGLAAFALLLAMASPFAATQTADSEQISKLLSEAKSHAVLADDDAATLESFTNSQFSWKTHAATLVAMKGHINELGKVSKQLNDLRDQASPWQHLAINQIDPLLRDMATQLTATINHLNDNPSRIHLQPYRNYAHANHDLASRTAEVISDLVEYDKAKSKTESLEQNLELPAANKGE
jgi:DNA repair ATPase RecN